MNYLASFLTSLVLFSSVAHANGAGYFRFGGMYFSETEGQKTDSTQTRMLMDVGAGFIREQGWSIGIQYGLDTISYGSTKFSRSSMGPTLGWISRSDNGPYVAGTYYLTSERQDYTGTGYQFDLGYKVKLRKVAIGLQASYKHFGYGKQASTTLSPVFKNDYIDPYFTLLVEL